MSQVTWPIESQTNTHTQTGNIYIHTDTIKHRETEVMIMFV